MEQIYDGRLAAILLVPLVGSIFAYLLGRRGRSPGVIASLAAAISFFITYTLWSELPKESFFSYSLGSWISAGSLSLPLDLYFDRLSAIMCLVVTGVGFLIHLFSIGYMAEDPGRARFFAYLNLFLASMLLLVLGKSLVVMFIGWEGVGFCSYLLIGFWFTNRDYAIAGRKAFVMNRIGDVGFLIAMFTIYTACGTLDFTALSNPSVIRPLTGTMGLVAGLSLFFAATGKSAQIPLFTWLPDAMAGPTPVSALIHAATMVTAGLYLMARTAGIIELDPLVPMIITGTALATAFLAATIAVVQTDIKKVLAYSTVSQLGFMFLAIGAGGYIAAIFHVVTHAFFKACLFLGAGSVIHGCHHEQDMRRMGGLARALPFTCVAYLVSTLAIAGIWPFAGYFSKHAILEAVAHPSHAALLPYAPFVHGTALFIATLTAFYMGRSFVLTFLGEYRGEAHPHESPAVMTLPVMLLAALSIFGGWLLQDRFAGYLVEVLPALPHEAAGEGAGHLAGSLPGIIGLVCAIVIFLTLPRIASSLQRTFSPVYRVLQGRYFIDEILQAVVVQPVYGVAGGIYRVVDRSIVDGGVAATGYISSALGELTRRATTGQVGTYVLLMFVAASVLIGIFIQR